MNYKATFTIIFCLLLGLSYSQNVTIPDSNFKAYLLSSTSINTVNDGEISVEEAEAFLGQTYFLGSK